MRRLQAFDFSLFSVVFLVIMVGWASSRSLADSPATLVEAGKSIDLSALPLVSEAEKPQHGGLAGLNYEAPGTVKNAYEFHRKQLLDRKWKELPGSYTAEESSSGTFSRDGFLVSLMVYSAGKAGKVEVAIKNHGNVKMEKLPVPKGVKPFYGGPLNASYITDASVDQTAEECKKLLTSAGWEPYGTAIGMQFFKQNAVRLNAFIRTAPAEKGKTVIDYTTELMSADLPAPADVQNLQYSDSPSQLYFESSKPQKEIADFYRKSMEKAGWKATTDSFVEIDSKNELIFRNPAKEMLTLEMKDYSGKNRVMLKFQSAAEVAAEDARAEAAIAKKKAEANKPLPKLAIAIPAGAVNIEQKKNRIEFKLSSGKAKPIIESWRKEFGKGGWKEEAVAIEDMAGSITFVKGEQSLTVIYSDTGFLPAEITLQTMGVELEKAAEKR